MVPIPRKVRNAVREEETMSIVQVDEKGTVSNKEVDRSVD